MWQSLSSWTEATSRQMLLSIHHTANPSNSKNNNCENNINNKSGEI
jgi:hypothetical protein